MSFGTNQVQVGVDLPYSGANSPVVDMSGDPV